MSLKDLQGLLRLYGPKATLVNVAANMKLLGEMGEKFQKEGSEQHVK